MQNNHQTLSSLEIIHNIEKGGNIYNIGGRNERTNLQIVDAICSILDDKVPKVANSGCEANFPRKDGSYKELITFVGDRAGHDRCYIIDASKLENEFGWKADENFDSGIIKTIEWYLEKYNGI